MASLLTSTKNTAVLNIIPIPSQFWMETYQSLWNISQILLRRQPIGTKTFHCIDWLLSHIIRVGYYPLIDTGLDLDQIYCEKDGRDFTMIFNNNTLMYRDIYIGLFYALKSNLILNTKDIRIAISFAHTSTRQFTLHNNTLFNENTTLSKYLLWTEPNLKYLSRNNYLDEFIPVFTVQVWDMDLPSNSHIKVHKTGTFTVTPKSYSTLASSLITTHSPLSDPQPIHVADTLDLTPIPENKKIATYFKKSNITPLSIPHNIIPMGIIAMDIETMKHPDMEHQIPVLVTISLLPGLDTKLNLEPINSLFHINKAAWGYKGLDLAIKDMWYQVFQYLYREIECSHTSRNVIFLHNLGGFDGDFILKALLLQFGKDCVQSMMDKEHHFIQIEAQVMKGGEQKLLVFKDSLRLFDVTLEKLCENFGVKGKISPYNKSWQNLHLFTHKKYEGLLNQFKKYAEQDSLGLLQALALLEAQKFYAELHQVDICSIWSTSTLSLKIFRMKYLKKNIPSLNRELDSFVRDGYFGGATDHYQLYGENLFYYDVNSLYPYAMLKDIPLEPAGFHPHIAPDDLKNGVFFGFCLAHIECPKDIPIPLLPHREVSGNVYYPTGQWQGVYFSEILREVMKYGYKVTPIQGHAFHKAKIFNEYIDHFYDIKKNSEGAARFIAKMHLNQLYGYFGRSQETIMTRNVTKAELREISITSFIESTIKIHEDLYVVLMKGNLNHQLLDQMNQMREDNTWDMSEFIKLDKSVKSHVGIAAAVTAYAQMEMMKYKTLPGISVYYTDTDSIFIDKALPNNLEGKELGEMKNELGKGVTIDKAIFLGNKKYGYTVGNKDFSTFSGAKKNKITFDEIRSISLGNEIVKTYDDVFVRTMSTLDITIKERKITLRLSSDKKLKGNYYIPRHIHQKQSVDSNSQRELKQMMIKWLRKMVSLLRK